MRRSSRALGGRPGLNDAGPATTCELALPPERAAMPRNRFALDRLGRSILARSAGAWSARSWTSSAVVIAAPHLAELDGLLRLRAKFGMAGEAGSSAGCVDQDPVARPDPALARSDPGRSQRAAMAWSGRPRRRSATPTACGYAIALEGYPQVGGVAGSRLPGTSPAMPRCR